MKLSGRLNRLLITGNINFTAPLCVLIEIADAHGVIYTDEDIKRTNIAHILINSISKAYTPTINDIESKDLTIEELQHIARFINKNSKWTKDSLIDAYNFLINFMNYEDPLINIPNDFIVGLQTPENPRMINACVLYKTCVYHRLNINSLTTVNQMAYAVSLLRENIESVMRKAKLFIKSHAKRTDLINSLMMSPHPIFDPKNSIMTQYDIDYDRVPVTPISHEILNSLNEPLNNIRELQQKIKPSTAQGAIALAAINYAIDISKSINPLNEYKALKICNRDNYNPSDLWMKYWYSKNSVIFDLFKTFNPLFPINYYNEKQLTLLAEKEGFNHSEISNSNPYELLQMSYVMETFYQDEMPNMKSKTTPITMDDINEISQGELLCYGQFEGPLMPISIQELIDLFELNKNFTNPFNSNSIYSTISINKLKYLLQHYDKPNVKLTENTIFIRNKLLGLIISIEILTRTTDEPTRELIFTYHNATPETKSTIINCLSKLLHMGLYMRGWHGIGYQYPINSAISEPEREIQISTNVTNSIAEYEQLCRSLGKIGTSINNLPLVKYRDTEYQISNSHEIGFTIHDRINIVREGDDSDNINSCIRLSSNYFCATAHKYITSLGQPPPFDIFNLRWIS